MRISATAVVFDETRSRVLLQLREDVRLWGLPGGGGEPGETPEQTAIRETLEETGYRIVIDRHVGEYVRPQMKTGPMRLYEGHVVGGDSSGYSWESVAVGWYPIDKLPIRTLRWAREMIADALSDAAAPVNKVQTLPGPHMALLRAALAIRDIRNRILKWS